MATYKTSAELHQAVCNKLLNNTPVVSEQLLGMTMASVQDSVGDSTEWPSLETMRQLFATMKEDRVIYN